MAEPGLVAQCYTAMSGAVEVPVTVKCRLGIDDQNIEETLPRFIETVAAAGCTHFIIHARKAWLQGLSPKDNRSVPPLDYDKVRQMKAAYPELEIILNGGLETIAQSLEETQPLDGFMMGRAAYHTPWELTKIDHDVYGGAAFAMSREDIAALMIDYAASREGDDRSVKALMRHIMGLFAGQPGARLWRRTLSESNAARLKPSECIEAALTAMIRARAAA